MVTPPHPAMICVSGAERGCRETGEELERKEKQGWGKIKENNGGRSSGWGGLKGCVKCRERRKGEFMGMWSVDKWTNKSREVGVREGYWRNWQGSVTSVVPASSLHVNVMPFTSLHLPPTCSDPHTQHTHPSLCGSRANTGTMHFG